VLQLRQQQEQTYSCIQRWANDKFGVCLRTSESLFTVDQDPVVSFAYADYLAAMPYTQLLAVTELSGACKSVLIAFALNEEILTVAQVCFVSIGPVAKERRRRQHEPVNPEARLQ
jgi:chaperone required for assembly of F1-ATPase